MGKAVRAWQGMVTQKKKNALGQTPRIVFLFFRLRQAAVTVSVSDNNALIRADSNPAAEQLLADIGDAYDTLSRQLKQIARYVEHHRDHIGLDRIQDVAQRCEVQPSAVIRFAKRFGFSGYTEMQKILSRRHRPADRTEPQLPDPYRVGSSSRPRAA